MTSVAILSSMSVLRQHKSHSPIATSTANTSSSTSATPSYQFPFAENRTYDYPPNSLTFFSSNSSESSSSESSSVISNYRKKRSRDYVFNSKRRYSDYRKDNEETNANFSSPTLSALPLESISRLSLSYSSDERNSGSFHPFLKRAKLSRGASPQSSTRSSLPSLSASPLLKGIAENLTSQSSSPIHLISYSSPSHSSSSDVAISLVSRSTRNKRNLSRDPENDYDEKSANNSRTRNQNKRIKESPSLNNRSFSRDTATNLSLASSPSSLQHISTLSTQRCGSRSPSLSREGTSFPNVYDIEEGDGLSYDEEEEVDPDEVDVEGYEEEDIDQDLSPASSGSDSPNSPAPMLFRSLSRSHSSASLCTMTSLALSTLSRKLSVSLHLDNDDDTSSAGHSNRSSRTISVEGQDSARSASAAVHNFSSLGISSKCAPFQTSPSFISEDFPTSIPISSYAQIPSQQSSYSLSSAMSSCSVSSVSSIPALSVQSTALTAVSYPAPILISPEPITRSFSDGLTHQFSASMMKSNSKRTETGPNSPLSLTSQNSGKFITSPLGAHQDSFQIRSGKEVSSQTIVSRCSPLTIDQSCSPTNSINPDSISSIVSPTSQDMLTQSTSTRSLRDRLPSRFSHISSIIY